MSDTSVGELVDQLFKTHRRADGKEFTYQEVAARLNGEIDPTYIGKLRSGKVPNPGRNVLKLLCLFFEVPASYFFPELERKAQADDAYGLTQEKQLQIVLRSLGLAPDLQVHVQALISALRHQQLDEAERQP